jgi:hypothetical protein
VEIAKHHDIQDHGKHKRVSRSCLEFEDHDGPGSESCRKIVAWTFLLFPSETTVLPDASKDNLVNAATLMPFVDGMHEEIIQEFKETLGRTKQHGYNPATDYREPRILLKRPPSIGLNLLREFG